MYMSHTILLLLTTCIPHTPFLQDPCSSRPLGGRGRRGLQPGQMQGTQQDHSSSQHLLMRHAHPLEQHDCTHDEPCISGVFVLAIMAMSQCYMFVLTIMANVSMLHVQHIQVATSQ